MPLLCSTLTHTAAYIWCMWVCVCVCVVLAPFHNARSRRNCIFIAARCLYVLKSVLYLLFIYGLLLSAFLFSPLFASLLALPSLFFPGSCVVSFPKFFCFIFFGSFRFSLRFLWRKWIFENGSSHMRLSAAVCVCVCVWILGLAEITTGTDIVRSLETICMILKVLLGLQTTR